MRNYADLNENFFCVYPQNGDVLVLTAEEYNESRLLLKLFKRQHKLFLSHGCLSWAPTAGLATSQIVALF